MTRLTVVVCDLCEKDIKPNTRYLNAGVYGKECHAQCFEKLTAFEVLWFLGLDEVEHEILGSDTDTRVRAMTKPDMKKWQVTD